MSPSPPEPIRAWKLANVAVGANRDGFEALTRKEAYGAEAVATCSKYHREDERVPDPECTCGFYALRHRSQLRISFCVHPVATLEVELFGRVIVGTRGYRAERQRVLRVHLPRRCCFVVSGEHLPRSWPYDRCGRPSVRVFGGVIDLDESLPTRPDPHQSSLVGMCGEHTIELATRGVAGSRLADIANRLGTEVVWGD